MTGEILTQVRRILNPIKPCWKTLRSLALAGCFFQTRDETEEAISRAIDNWSATVMLAFGAGAGDAEWRVDLA